MDMIGGDLGMIALLTLVGVLAGFIDSIAGGGGLITVPALLMVGLDPVSALATNKLQSTFGSFSAAYAFIRAGHIRLKTAFPMAAASLIGSVAGAASVKILPVELLAGFLPLILVGVAIYFLLSPRMRDEDAKARISPAAFIGTAAFGIGFYDGCFGPGTGSFFMIAFVTLLGFAVVKAVAYTKLLNFASNIGALAFFILAGGVNWSYGIGMGIGQFIGARLGAGQAMRNGARIIRPLLVVVSSAMAIRLMLDPANPLRMGLISLWNASVP